MVGLCPHVSTFCLPEISYMTSLHMMSDEIFHEAKVRVSRVSRSLSKRGLGTRLGVFVSVHVCVCTCVCVYHHALYQLFKLLFCLSFSCKCPSLALPDPSQKCQILPFLPARVWPHETTNARHCWTYHTYPSFSRRSHSLGVAWPARTETCRMLLNALGSTAIRESTAAGRSEVLLRLSCIVLLAASRTAAEMMFSA